MTEADNKQFVIVDLVTWERMIDGLRTGMAMAQSEYSFIVPGLDFTRERVRQYAETFMGSHNKPQTTPMYAHKKEVDKKLKEEAHYRLYSLLQGCNCHAADLAYIEKNDLGCMNMYGTFRWNNDKLFKMSNDELIAFVKRYVLTPEEWEQGLDSCPATRTLIRAIYDLEDTESKINQRK